MIATLLPRGGFLSDFHAAARLLLAARQPHVTSPLHQLRHQPGENKIHQKEGRKGKKSMKKKKVKMYPKYQPCERAGTYSGMNF